MASGVVSGRTKLTGPAKRFAVPVSARGGDSASAHVYVMESCLRTGDRSGRRDGRSTRVSRIVTITKLNIPPVKGMGCHEMSRHPGAMCFAAGDTMRSKRILVLECEAAVTEIRP
jgi:hypothetical protein